MYRLVILGLLIQSSPEQTVSPSDLAKITISNSGQPSPYRMTRLNVGPSVGDMLNNHFFPGIDYYNAGRYLNAQTELAYVIARPAYLQGNPRRNEFMSTSHYLMGMIYLYHADGLGRRNVAREHFDNAIAWNGKNYIAYLELSRVYAELRLIKQASTIIQRLLEMNPPENIKALALNELDK